ncbi:hypothetical protein LMG33818_000854 [Halomonadaceae bacterium LMG 33818]
MRVLEEKEVEQVSGGGWAKALQGATIGWLSTGSHWGAAAGAIAGALSRDLVVSSATHSLSTEYNTSRL